MGKERAAETEGQMEAPLRGGGGRNETGGALSPDSAMFRDAREARRRWIYLIHGQGGGGSKMLSLPI